MIDEYTSHWEKYKVSSLRELTASIRVRTRLESRVPFYIAKVIPERLDQGFGDQALIPICKARRKR